jgi:HTH-type transcriptional regulator/antitoxin HigA
LVPPEDHRTPGQLIEELLETRGWSKRILSVILGETDSSINKLVSGKQIVKADMALALGEVFGVAPERFLELQKSYELAQARIVAKPDPDRAIRAHLYGGLPVSEMISRGWLRAENMRDPIVGREIARFFGVSSINDIEILPHAAKKTDVVGPVSPAQLAWLYRVRQIANEVLVPRYSATALASAIPKLRLLLNAPENARHVPRILADCGIRFVIVESIGNAKVDGACFWLKDGAAPVVGMSFRFDRLDNFWFVLRHELEHVLLGHGRAAAMLDAELEGERAGSGVGVSEEERVANAAAADFCVPQDKLRRFVAVKGPFYPERDMLGFAKSIRVHPGIVAGQIRHATGRYELYAKYAMTKARSTVAPTATVDGWGDVVPLVQ